MGDETDYDEESEGDADNDNNEALAEPPEIKTKPQMIEVRPGSNVELPCYIVNGGMYTKKIYNIYIFYSFVCSRFFRIKKKIILATVMPSQVKLYEGGFIISSGRQFCKEEI